MDLRLAGQKARSPCIVETLRRGVAGILTIEGRHPQSQVLGGCVC